jgi:membrane protein implicated in regulation of membrane protease activity
MATPNALTYNGLITQVALLAGYKTQTVNGVVQGMEPDFTTLIPQMLNYAEDRVQRDLELLNLQTLSPAYTLTAGNPVLAVPTADFTVVQDVLVSGAPLNPVARSYIQTMWPPTSTPGLPTVFAMLGGDLATAGVTSTLILVGPTPDQPYPATLIGEVRAPSLATYANPAQAGVMTTWISTWLPELLAMAAMVYVSAYQRDFGRQADDPQMAQSYENQYGTLMQAAKGEDYRRRLEADAWTARAASPVATPTRT